MQIKWGFAPEVRYWESKLLDYRSRDLSSSIRFWASRKKRRQASGAQGLAPSPGNPSGGSGGIARIKSSDEIPKATAPQGCDGSGSSCLRVGRVSPLSQRASRGNVSWIKQGRGDGSNLPCSVRTHTR